MHMPGELGRALVRMDGLLRDSEMKFNIECPDCTMRAGRPVYVIPVERGGRVEFLCPHARRMSDLSAQ